MKKIFFKIHKHNIYNLTYIKMTTLITTNCMNVSFDDLVFHNPTNGLFEAVYNFPNNYQMSVKTERLELVSPDNRQYYVLHPNRYVVNILFNGKPVQTPINSRGEYHFQNENQVTQRMKQLLLWIEYNINENEETRQIDLQGLRLE
jgi:hypothetical protein